MRSPVVLVVVVTFVLSACGGSDSAGGPGDGTDASTDDASSDAARDDVGLDGRATDAGVDSTRDASTTDTSTSDASRDAADTPDAGCAPGRGTWVWGSDVVEKSADRDAFFAFAATHPVRTAYVEAEGLLGASADPPLLASFVAEAKAKCIDVQLLFGRATWLRPAEQANAVDLVTKSIAFAKKHLAAAPTGVHFDVEPHGVPEWHADVWDANNETLVGQYVDLLEKLKAATSGSGLELSVDIPFWYDGTHQITRAGKRRPAMEFVIDLVDVTTLMDYRDVADGSDGLVANADAELTYATTVGKRIVVGIETKCGLTPTSVTFCEEGSAAMEAQLALAVPEFKAKTAFAGIAIHHYLSWSTLKK